MSGWGDMLENLAGTAALGPIFGPMVVNGANGRDVWDPQGGGIFGMGGGLVNMFKGGGPGTFLGGVGSTALPFAMMGGGGMFGGMGGLLGGMFHGGYGGNAGGGIFGGL